MVREVTADDEPVETDVGNVAGRFVQDGGIVLKTAAYH